MLFSFYRWGAERLNDWPKVKQASGIRTGTQYLQDTVSEALYSIHPFLPNTLSFSPGLPQHLVITSTEDF